MPKSDLIKVTNLLGGVNDSDAPFAIADNEVAAAVNMDHRTGQLGSKRGGLGAISLVGSVLERRVPLLRTSQTGSWAGVAGGSMNIAASGAAANTNLILIVLVATNGTLAAAPTYLGVAMALITTQTVGGMTIACYRTASPTLTGGAIAATTTAASRGQMVGYFIDDVDLAGSPVFAAVDGNAGAVSLAQPSSANFDSRYLVLCGIMTNGSINGKTVSAVGTVISDEITDATAVTLDWEWKIGMKPTTQFNLATIIPASAWASVLFGLKGVVVGAEASTANYLRTVLRFSPTNDIAGDELWVQDNRGRIDRRVAGVWQLGIARQNYQVGITIALNDATYYATNGASLHGKFFLALDGVLYANRLHLWDGTVLRWAGFATPAAPTGADTAGAGTFAGTRYYRIRYIQKSGSTIIRRSEPSATLTFTPSGANTGIVVTKPAAGGFISGEGETHWELEASTDSVLFYLLATTVVGTTTVTDTTALATPATSTYSAGVLSASLTEYTPLSAARHVVMDQDRVLIGGSPAGLVGGGLPYTLADDSRVSWTPLRADIGVGNDERVPATSRFFQDLDGVNSGRLAHLLPASLGGIWAFKESRIYKLTRSGGTPAYSQLQLTDVRGCVMRGAATGIDAKGNPCVYFVDANAGGCRLDSGGLTDLMNKRVPIVQALTAAAPVIGRVLFYPKHWQVWFALTQGSTGTTPTIILCWNLLTNGWTDYSGQGGQMLSGVLFPDPTTRALQPYVISSFRTNAALFVADSGSQDDGVSFPSSVTTKNYAPTDMFAEFTIDGAVLYAPGTGAVNCPLSVSVIRNDTVAKTVPADIIGAAYQTKLLDDLTLGECYSAQLQISDGAGVALNWSAEALFARVTRGGEVG